MVVEIADILEKTAHENKINGIVQSCRNKKPQHVYSAAAVLTVLVVSVKKT